MPELPDVEMFKKEAGKAVGKKITDAEIKDRQFRTAITRSHAMVKSFLMDQSL